MDVKDLTKNYKNVPHYQFKRELNELVRSNYRYGNLSQKNRKVVSDLVRKYSTRIRSGQGISYDTIQRECYSLYKKRLQFGLTEEDLKDIKEILGMFKR